MTVLRLAGVEIQTQLTSKNRPDAYALAIKSLADLSCGRSVVKFKRQQMRDCFHPNPTNVVSWTSLVSCQTFNQVSAPRSHLSLDGCEHYDAPREREPNLYALFCLLCLLTIGMAFTRLSAESHAKHMRPLRQPRATSFPRIESVKSAQLPWSSAPQM